MKNKFTALLAGFLFILASAACADTNSRIVVTPQYMVFYAVEGATTAQQQTFAISNGSTGTLNFTVAGSSSWSNIDVTSGSATTGKTTVTVTVNPSGLTASGSPYINDVTVSNTDIPQDTKKVRVRLSILASDAYVHRYEYDSNGHVTRRITPNGDIIDYAYDPTGKLMHIYYPDGKEVDYTYDAAGNRLSMTDWHGTTTYTYDFLNRLQSITYPGIAPIIYGYDRSGKITDITYPDNLDTAYGYDADGRLTTVTYNGGTTTYQYDNTTNQIKQKTLPNGVYTTYAYDLAKRLTDTVNKKSDGTLISSYHYSYDANNNIIQEIDITASGALTKNYTYDKLNRLTRTDYSDGTFEAYTYDAMGNRLTMTTQAGTTTYDYDSDNRLLRAGDTYYFYDRNGNMIKKVSPQKTETYQYDFNNMLDQYSDGTTTVQYQYDGDRNRIARIDNGVLTNYVNDTNRPIVQVLMEADSNWVPTKKYIYGNGLLSQETF